MKKRSFHLIAAVAILVLSHGAIAKSMSKDDYKAGESKISSDHKAAKLGCDSLVGNASDICQARAKGQERVARAELEAAYTPSSTTRYKARVAKGKAEYAVAKEQCDDLAGNAKDVCMKQAKAARVAARADANVEKTTADANASASEKVTLANVKERTFMGLGRATHRE